MFLLALIRGAIDYLVLIALAPLRALNGVNQDDCLTCHGWRIVSENGEIVRCASCDETYDDPGEDIDLHRR